MNIAFAAGFLIGMGCGVVTGLAFAAMCFGVLAKLLIMAVAYRHQETPRQKEL